MLCDVGRDRVTVKAFSPIAGVFMTWMLPVSQGSAAFSVCLPANSLQDERTGSGEELPS